MDKKLNILLVCGSGASSSFMAAKMRLAAKTRGLDINIKARSESEIMNYVGDIDAIMVGPHLSQYYEDLKSRYEEECRIIQMDKDYYASLDGDKAIDHLLRELNKDENA